MSGADRVGRRQRRHLLSVVIVVRRAIRKREARYTPRQQNRRCRACWEGSYEGGGSLVGANDSSFPCGGVTIMEIASSLRWKNTCGGQFLEGKTMFEMDFGDVVARTSNSNVRLRR